MLHEKTKPSTPAKGRGADRGLLSASSGPVASLKRSENLPAYGAQHRQDALWEGGNEVLPPMWKECKVVGGDQLSYLDDALFMFASHRPLPGVRLDYPGQLIPGCEWHISPFGRSYFVNHNTRTTSWTKPTPERLAGCLIPECIIKCDNRANKFLACLGTSGNIMSTLGDGSIHQWTRAGNPVGKPFGSDGGAVTAMAISLDESMVVCGSSNGRVRLWNIKEGSVVGKPWEGNKDTVWGLDWSPNGLEVAGGFLDGTIRRWNPTTGRQIAPPIKTGTGDESVFTVKYSPQGDKFASGGDKIICVWSKDGELLIEIKGHNDWVKSLCWSMDGAYIFSASHDYTIRKWQCIDGTELAVFQGHTHRVLSICLSLDECLLVSASVDYSVRIWDLKSNQQVGDPLWHDDHVLVVAMSSDGQYFASAIEGPNAKINVWSLEAALKRARGVDGDADPNAKLTGHAARPRDISLVSRRETNNRGLARYGNDFFGYDTNRTPRRSADTSSLPGLRNLFGYLRSSPPPANSPQPTQLHPWRLHFGSFPVKISRRPADVAPCRDEDRYGIVPESDAEAAAAMQRTSSNNVDSSTAQDQAATGTPGSLGRPKHTTQGQSSTPDTEEPSYLIGCCGFYLVRRRTPSHQSFGLRRWLFWLLDKRRLCR